MYFTLLGSGGWLPANGRETCSALIREGDESLLIDGGSGIKHLIERSELLKGSKSLNILLTHFHHDHTCGLSYLPALPSSLPRPQIWGPGGWLYPETTEEILLRAFSMPQSAFDLGLIGDVGDIDSSGQKIGPLELTFRLQPLHSNPTLAIRGGEKFSYCTDTAFDKENIEFVSGSKLLFHEAWSPSFAPQNIDKHATSQQAAEIAMEAEVEKLILIHLNPLIKDQNPLLEESRNIFESSQLSFDLMSFSI